MKVSAVSGTQMFQAEKAVEDEMGADAQIVKAVNVSFYNKDGKEIEPKKPVSVKFVSKEFKEIENPTVIHIADNGDAAKVANSANGSTVSFKADEFSVYAVVEFGEKEDDSRLLVKFMNGDTVIDSMYVKKDDNMEQVIYDPGVPEVANKSFMGWTTTKEYTSETEGKTIEAVREEVKSELNKGVEEGAEIKYYAILFNTYRLYYADENGTVFETVVGTSTTDEVTLTVDEPYSVSSPDKGFIGWKVKDSTDTKIYKNGDEIKISADTTLLPEIADGHWLYFDENDGGAGVGNASYTPPAFIEGSRTAAEAKPSDPTRPGYEFKGWFTEATDGEEFDFDTILSEDTTIYAHWEASQSAEYKIIIWQQKVTDDKDCADEDKTYSYFETITQTAATDTPITESMLSQYLNYGNSEFGVTDLANGSKAFKYRTYEIKNGSGADKNGVSATGNTVVNVYYDRELFTIVFKNAKGTGTVGEEMTYYEKTTSNGSGLYGIVNGEYVLLNFDDNRYGEWTWDSASGQKGKYTGKLYTSKENAKNDKNGIDQDAFDWSSYSIGKTVSGYYGRYRDTAWGQTVYYEGVVNGTCKGTISYSYNGIEYTGSRYKIVTVKGYSGLYGQSLSKYGYKWPEGMWNNIAFVDSFTGSLFGADGLGTVENHIETTTSTTKSNTTIIFYVHDAENSSSYVEAGRTVYSLKNTQGFRITERFIGTKVKDYAWSTSSNLPTDGWDVNTDNGITSIKRGNNTYLHIRYNLQTSDIVFMYGTDVVKTVKDIPYGKGLSRYEKETPTTDSLGVLPEGYTFIGWYEDPEFTTKASWSGTMPLGNKTIYAKVEPVEYHVAVDLNGGTMAQDTHFWRPYGDKLDDTNFNKATKEGKYSLVGWYTDPGLTKPWNFDTRLTDASMSYLYEGANDPLRAGYPAGKSYPSGLSDEGYPSTVGVLTLYAKWRDDSIAESGGIHVKYVNPEGAPVYTLEDSLTYADQAEVYAAAAPEEKYWPEGKQFAYWQLDKKTYFPAQTFTADKDLAKDEEGKLIITLTAVYKDKETHTPTHINWYKNDGTDAFKKSGGLKINEAVDIENAPSRDGYKFLGWARVDIGNTLDAATTWEATESNWTQNLTESNLYLKYSNGKYTLADGTAASQVAADEDTPYHAMFAVWEKTYTVTWKSQDGSDTLETDTDVSKGTKPSFDGKTPTKAADAQYTYTFAGWATEPNAESGTAAGSLPAVTEDVTYYAAFSKTPNKYIVTWKNDDGTVLETDEEVEYGTTPTYDGATPTKVASAQYRYTFAGWNPEVSAVTGDTTYTATYDKTVNKYTVTFDTDGGSANPDSQTVDYGEKATKPADPTKTGYTFINWFNKVTDTVFDIVTTAITENTDLKAKWNVNQYTITFDTDGGSTIDPITQDYGTDVTAPADPTKTGYTFAGWDTEVPETMPAENLTITAQWTINQYTVTFDAQGHGTAPDAQTVNYNEKATEPESLAADGYTFGGWYTETACTNAYNFNTAVTADITLYAKWTPIEYTITYDLDGGSLAEGKTNPEKYTIESNDITLNNPTKTGYTFAGWTGTDLSGATKTVTIVKGSTGDREYTATWTINQYTVTFVDEDGTTILKEATKYNYGTQAAEIAKPADPTKPGYKFNGWDPEITEVTENATYKATYVADDSQNYTVVYETSPAAAGSVSKSKNDGIQVLSTDGVTGSKATAADGYVFDGWYKGETQITTDAELNANDAKSNLNKNGTLYADTTYTAKFDKDENGDGIADKYQKKVTFEVDNGSWNDGKSDAITVYVTLLKDGKPAEDGTGHLTAGQIPAVGNKPADTYKSGDWDTEPTTSIEFNKDSDATTTYTYTYTKKGEISAKVTFKVVNGEWNDGGSDDVVVDLSGYEGDTLKLTADQIPAAGNKPADTYKEGSWDTTPAAGEVKSGDDITYTYTYAVQTYTIIYTDGVEGIEVFADQTSTVEYGSDTPAFDGEPTRTGYTFIGWSPEVAKTVTGDAEYTAQWTAVEPDPEPTPTPDPTPTPTPAGPTDDDDDDTPTPAGGGGGGAAAVVPAAAAGTPAATTIADDPTPQAEPETIIDDPTPQAAPEGTWALLNLLAAALSTLGAVVAAFRKKEDEDDDPDSPDNDDEEDNRGRKMTTAKVLGAAAAAASIVAFILTEDMSQQMAMVDNWTVLMAALFAGQIGTAVANKKASEVAEDEEDAE